MLNNTLSSIKSIIFVSLFLCIFLSGCSKTTSTAIKIKKNYSVVSINKSWSVIDNNNNFFLSSFPIISSTGTQNREVHYLILVYIKEDNSYIFSIVGGKKYDNLSKAIIMVNNNYYYLPVSEDRAWLTNKDQALNLIKDIVESDRLIVLNKFYDDSKATDIYALEGFKESFQTLNRLIKN